MALVLCPLPALGRRPSSRMETTTSAQCSFTSCKQMTSDNPDVVEQLESECCGISFEGLRVLCPDVEGADSGAPAGGLHLLEKHRLEISQRIRVGVRGGGAGRRSQLHGDKQCKLMLAKD